MSVGDHPLVQLSGMVVDLHRTLNVVLMALDGGEPWEIDHARRLAQQTLDELDGLAQPHPAPCPTPQKIYIPLTRKVRP